MAEMKTLTINGETYEVCDETARDAANGKLPLSGGTMTGPMRITGGNSYIEGEYLAVGQPVPAPVLSITKSSDIDQTTLTLGSNRFTLELSGFEPVLFYNSKPLALQDGVNSHVNNKNNPHGVTLSQLGVTATAAELNYVDGVTSNVQTQLNNKANDYSLELYNGTGGNPKPVRFASFNYSTCDSENGIAAKIGMVSGHGNGSSYAFMQDAIIKVSHTGAVSVDNFKYYGAATGAYDGADRQYGDIFWLTDATNKIIDFYCLMGQYARLNMTPWKRLTYSSKGSVTQHTSCTVYSSGTKTWGNNSEIALMIDLAAKAPLSHTHTKSQITDFPTSMTPTAHNQAASTITAGTFAGQVVANSSGQTTGTSLLRNSKLVSADTNPTVNGEICWTYG